MLRKVLKKKKEEVELFLELVGDCVTKALFSNSVIRSLLTHFAASAHVETFLKQMHVK